MRFRKRGESPRILCRARAPPLASSQRLDRPYLHLESGTVSAYVLVHLSPTRAAHRMGGEPALHPALAHRKVKELLRQHGGELVGTNAAASSGDATASATIAVSDMACAPKLATALREVDGFETAYAKPAEEL